MKTEASDDVSKIVQAVSLVVQVDAVGLVSSDHRQKDYDIYQFFKGGDMGDDNSGPRLGRRFWLCRVAADSQ